MEGKALTSVNKTNLVLEKLSPILGWTAVDAMMRNALTNVGKRYRFMKELEFEEGFLEKGLDDRLKGVPNERIERAFQELLRRFFDILRSLTGDILINLIERDLGLINGKDKYWNRKS